MSATFRTSAAFCFGVSLHIAVAGELCPTSLPYSPSLPYSREATASNLGGKLLRLEFLDRAVLGVEHVVELLPCSAIPFPTPCGSGDVGKARPAGSVCSRYFCKASWTIVRVQPSMHLRFLPFNDRKAFRQFCLVASQVFQTFLLFLFFCWYIFRPHFHSASL